MATINQHVVVKDITNDFTYYSKRHAVDVCLEKEIQNDVLYDSAFILIHMKDGSLKISDYLARRMYEAVYLKRKCSKQSPNRNMIRISILEAIQYIYQITPPRLQIGIESAIHSVNDIIGLLKEYLMNQESMMYQYNLDYFFNKSVFCSYKDIQPIWRADTAKIDFLSKYNSSRISLVIIHSEVDLSDACSPKRTLDIEKCRQNKKDTLLMMKISPDPNKSFDPILFDYLMDSASRLQVINMKITKEGIYVILHTDDLRPLNRWIHVVSFTYNEYYDTLKNS